MRALFVGDVVGEPAAGYLSDRLPGLRRELELDLVVVNAENCGPAGVGMTVQAVTGLQEAGADVITAGNHAFDGPESSRVLALPRVIRPLNLAPGVQGRGLVTVEVCGEPVTVMVLADASALALTPVAAHGRRPWEAWVTADRPGTVIVDFHAQSVMEKQSFAHAVDGAAAAILGTHTHEPTLPLHLLPGGTALVTEVGMTGAHAGPQGFDVTRFVEIVRGTAPSAAPPVAPARGTITLGAVLLEISGGRTHTIQRVT